MNKEIMRMLNFDKEVTMVEDGVCPMCGDSVDIREFSDALSYKEFKISGLCQKCQNETFGAS